MKKSPAYAVTSVDHALRLAVMLQVEGSMRLSDVAERLQVAPSTAHRLLSMLVYRDFAVQGEDRRYCAGPVLTAGRPVRGDAGDLRVIARPHLEGLTERVAETSNLVVLAGEHTRFLDSVESPRLLRIGTREGAVLPAHLASGGLALLAERSDEEIETLYSPERFADRADRRPDVPLLMERLRAVRSHGFALNVELTEKGLVAVGRVVHDADGHAPAAVSVSLPAVRYGPDRLPGLVSALTRTVRDIEADLAR